MKKLKVALMVLLLVGGCQYLYPKSVLIVGDSISIGYTAYLQSELGYGYRVAHTSGNARSTGYTRANLDQWLAQLTSKPNIIIWNNGVWNAVNNAVFTKPADTPPGYEYGTSLAQYESDLIAIAARLTKTGASRIIFVTTTDIRPGDRFFSIQSELNAIATRVLPPLGVEITDLNRVSQELVNEHIDEVHFNEKAYQRFGVFIAAALALRK